MIIGLVALIGLIFGAGGQDYFYLHDFDKHISKFVEDKEKKKELQSYLKDYQKAVKEYNKKHKDQLELFKKKNLDKTTSIQWYQDFFSNVMELRKERQANAIDFRLLIQPKITDEEWQHIVNEAKDESSKLIEKANKKEDKKKDSDSQQLSKREESYVKDKEKHEKIIESLDEFTNASLKLRASYDEFNAITNQLLVDKEASEEQMWEVVNSANELRQEMYNEFLGFLETLKNNTNKEEWADIMKDLNKELDNLKY